ncbi:MAG: hypothetical protein D6698_16660 [Gammaproteobacteria bacterium]|nr:MAG: hypothetical protein D6698_16660 [Gammaproteobacteria bacterium]
MTKRVFDIPPGGSVIAWVAESETLEREVVRVFSRVEQGRAETLKTELDGYISDLETHLSRVRWLRDNIPDEEELESLSKAQVSWADFDYRHEP